MINVDGVLCTEPYFPINLFRFCWYFMTHTSIRHRINGCMLKDKKDDGKKKMMHNETFYSDWLKQALWLWSPSNKTRSFSPTVRMSPLDSCQGMDCKHWAILGVLGFILLVLPVALFVLRNRFHRSTGNNPAVVPSLPSMRVLDNHLNIRQQQPVSTHNGWHIPYVENSQGI